jgi:hypothetical protein
MIPGASLVPHEWSQIWFWHLHEETTTRRSFFLVPHIWTARNTDNFILTSCDMENPSCPASGDEDVSSEGRQAVAHEFDSIGRAF